MKRAPSSSERRLPRQLTAVGTVGEKGQLFTVLERNWQCKSCDQENYPIRVRCTRCRKKKPEGAGHDYVQDPALLSLKAGEVVSWQEAVDPATNQIYYYNSDTRATQWERPIEMGEAPIATGWFGRGQVGSMAASQYTDNNTQYLSQPAKKQKDFVDPKKYHVEGANEYNIWYDRYVGDTKDNSALREPAEDRCIVKRDAGFTKADKGGWNRKEKRHFCLHFARGICSKGDDCTYYHRVPLPTDNAACEEMVDCFGRQRHATHRDNMSGVGSFMNPSRTLFVGGLTKAKYDSPKCLEESVWRHFSEWGELENVNVVHRLSIAFPRYRLRTSAEFAREAMACQTLDHQEILSIRWAKDDPNPVAQDSISRADKDALAALLDAKGFSTQSAPFEYPINYTMPPPKRSRTEYDTDCPEFQYPDTDGQYTGQEGEMAAQQFAEVPLSDQNEDSFASLLAAVHSTLDSSSTSSSRSAVNGTNFIDESEGSNLSSHVSAVAASVDFGSILEDIEAMKRRLSSMESLTHQGSSAQQLHRTGVEEHVDDVTEKEKGDGEIEGIGKDGEWTAHTDPDTGATYYYNSSTGESSWGNAPSS